MPTTIETEFVRQSRWNGYGRSVLAKTEVSPEQFFVDPTRLPATKASLVAALGDIAGKRILDFGSGRGELSVALAKLGASVTGIDIGESLVEVAKRIATINNVQCDFVVGSIDRLSFQDSSFDFVVGNAILHHLPKQGIVDSLSEAYRVLKPGGMALFIEPIENSRLFDFLQNVIPAGKGEMPAYRPSILQRAKWKAFLATIDDRALSNAELANAKGSFRDIEFKYFGLLIRLKRLWPSPRLQRVLATIDSFLTHDRSPLKKLGQTVLVVYRK